MRVTINIPDPVGKETEKVAREEGLSVSALYARAVEDHLERRRRNQAAQRIDALIGKARVAPDAAEQIGRERKSPDRKLR